MEDLAKLLGIPKEKLKKLTEEMGEFTGKKDVPVQFFEKIKAERQEALRQLGLTESSSRAEVLGALGDKVAELESSLLSALGDPNPSDHAAIHTLFDQAGRIAKPPKGLFLKEEKAVELFRANPPKNILDKLGYGSVDALLEKEDLLEVYSALRFMEDRKWLNEVFFAPLSSARPEDFEKRAIALRILDPKRWGAGARDFVRKKFHNTTHLKELGVLIVIPMEYQEGVLTRMFSMMFHYLSEISFYAKYFALISGDSNIFAKRFVSSLRGDVRESVPPVENMVAWVIMQRYLAKENPNDERLLLPRVSPEALHWKKAVSNLTKLGGGNSNLGPFGSAQGGLSFWDGKAHLLDFFDGKLTSFNFEDNVFSLAAGPDTSQYTYHAREALWNRFLAEWFDKGEGLLETLMIEDFGQGFIGFKIHPTSSKE